MKKLITILCIYNFLLFAQEPNWVKERPVSNRYFIGIGFADKNNKDYRAVAKAEALNDLASEISVTISSELIDIMVEYSGFSEEYARSEIRMSTREELDGYERVDDYNGKDFYWMYYRMSYKYFEGYAKNAISLYDDYLYSDKNDLVGRLQLLIPSLEYIYKAVRQDVYHESDGKRTNLRVEVPRLIKTIVNNIDISSPKIGYEAYYGRGIDEPIEVSLRNRINNKPIAFTNMEVFFERGDGKILNENPQTDGKGKINPRITQINSKLEEQVVKIAIKLTEFKADINKSTYINNVLKGMARNRALSIGIKVSEFRKDKVGVLVVGDGINPMLLSSLMSKFNYEYKRQTDFDIMDPREAESILEREGFDIEPCTSYECQVEIGQKLGVDNLVYIKIVYLRDAKLITVSTVFSEIYTRRVARSTEEDLNVKRNQTADEVLIANVPMLVENFWNSFNPGTLIINSSIPKVNVEISNNSNLKDRPENRNTDFKIELAPGLYNLHFEKLGYITRDEKITIAKSDQRAITVELTKKTALNAFLRSAVIPGSGQYYSSDRQNIGRAKMGKIIRIGIISSLLASGYTYYSYDQAKTDYETANNTYLSQTTLEEINASRIIAQDKNQVMLANQTIFTASLSLFGILWVGNAFEALLNFPDFGYSISANTHYNPDEKNTIVFEPTISFTYNF